MTRRDWGVERRMVRDAESGTVLYQAHAEQRLAPASNMKMFTPWRRSGVLGRITGLKPGCRPPASSGDTWGDLICGSGDPTPHPTISTAFAATLAQRGIRHGIHGRPIPDASVRSNAIRRRPELGR
ncbi:D-alanyl-D-alanine carboxypeptidase [Serratia ureilytica]